MKSNLSKKPMVLVDLNAGRWILTKIGHEYYNLMPNETDGRFYGYCPPYGGLNIRRLGASSNDEYIDGVLVVYTQKIQGSADREIIAFTDDARVYREKRTKSELGRKIIEDGKEIDCAYSVESDNLYNLKDYPLKFIIHAAKYNPYMFRGQRCYMGSYPALDEEVVNYLQHYLDDVSDEDTLVFQRIIQEEKASSDERSSDSWSNEPQYSVSGGSKAVIKNAHTSKLALLHAGFHCAANKSHTTFQTARGVQYMEGHHLIPCTYTNATRFWEERERNIDCEENIVCLCPTCHRQVHFGSKDEKEALLKVLYEHQIKKLESVGLGLSFEELISLY